MNSVSIRNWLVKLFLASAVGLAGCGGGGGGGGSSSSSASILALSGVAATGLPIAGGSVSAKCVTGTGTTTSAGNGSWSISITGGVGPCVIEVTIGATKLHSYALASGVINVTPLTEEILRLALPSGTTPTAFFANPAGVTLTSAQLLAAETVVRNDLTNRGVTVTAIQSPGALLTQPFVANGQGIDQVLDELATVLGYVNGLGYAVQTNTLSLTTTGAGAVSSSPAGISGCVTGPCTASFLLNQAITLTATATAGNIVSAWGGDCAGPGTTGGATGTCALTMNAGKTVSVTFAAIPTNMLTVTTSGGGSVTTSPPVIVNCSGPCPGLFAVGAVVTVTANATLGNVVSSWGGDCAGSATGGAIQTCTVTMNAVKSATVGFSGAPPTTATLTVSNTGSGSVSSAPAGIACGATCTTSFTINQVVALTATPTAGNTVTSWTGACLGIGTTGATGTCNVTMNVDKSAGAVFSPNQQTLNFTASGAGAVTSSTGGIVGLRAGTQSETVTQGTVMTLTATADAGNTVTPASWGGACASPVGTGNGASGAVGTCAVTMSVGKTANVTFAPLFSVTTSVSGLGTVTSNVGGINCPGTCTTGATLASGTSVTLTATPTAGNLVTAWSGDCAATGTLGATGTCTVSANPNRTGGVTFTPAFDLTVTVSGGTGTSNVTSNSTPVGVPANISCTQAGGASCVAKYPTPTSVTLTPNPDVAQSFTSWTGTDAGGVGCLTNSPTCTVTMSAGRAVTANFAAVTGAPLKVSVAGVGTVSDGGSISCDRSIPAYTGACSANVSGSVTLSATTDGAHTFVGWFGPSVPAAASTGCSGTGPCIFTKTGATQYVTAVFAPNASAPSPLALYTDITSGPIGCLASCGIYTGENNNGIYLSVFGKNFGSSVSGGSAASGDGTVKVYLDNIEVTRYMYLGVSKGRRDFEQVSTQIGPLASVSGSVPAGTVLPIKVVVDGRVSNTSLSFTVNAGKIYFVNNTVAGTNDVAGTTTGGTFAAPFKTVQKPGGDSGAPMSPYERPASTDGAWGRVRAGDFMVLRGTGTPWTAIGLDTYFFRAANKSGCTVGSNCAAGGGTSSGPITLMGYPGEDVFINNAYAGTAANLVNDCTPGGVEVSSDSPVTGAISGANSTNGKQANGGFGWNINIVGLRVEGGNDDGVVNLQTNSNFWRVVNNELTAATAVNNMCERSGGVVGAGAGSFWTGNWIHDIFQGTPASNDAKPRQNHAMYIGDDPATGPAASYDIGYNLMENISGGNGFQIHSGGITDTVNNVSLHHNIIRNVGKHGINIADGATSNIKIWNNVIYNTFLAGIRFGGTSFVSGLKLYNNTFFNTNTFGTTNYAAILNEMNAAANQFDIRNNIFVPKSGTLYSRDDAGAFNLPASTAATNNLWFGGTNYITGAGTQGGTPSGVAVTANGAWSTASQTGNPLFVSTTGGSENLRIPTGSPAKNTGTGIAAVTAVVVDDNDVADAALTQITRPQGGLYDIGGYEFH